MRSPESTNSKDRARYRAQYSSETGFLENSAFRVQTADPFSENGRPSRTGASQPNHQHIAANLFREGAAGLGHSPMRTTRNATFQVKEEDLQGSDLKAPKKPTLQPLSMTLSSLNPHGSSNFQYQPRPARNLFYGSCEPNFLFAEGGNSLLNNRAPQQSPNPAEMDLRGFTNHDAIGMGLLGPSSGMYGLGFPMSDSTFGNLGPQPYFFMPEPATDRLGPSFRMLGQSPIKLEGYGAGDPMLQTPQKRKPSQIKLSDGYNQDFDDDRDFFRAYPDEVQSRMFSAEKTNPNTGYYGRQPNMHPPSMAGGHATQIGFGFHEHTKIRSAYMTVGGMQTHMERGPNHPDHLHQTPRNNRDLHGNGHGGYYPKGSQLADLDTTGTMKKRRIMHSTELTGASQRSPSDQESRFGSRRVSRTYYGLGLKGTSLDHLNSTKKRLNLDGNSAQQQKYNRNAYLQNDPNNNETSNQMSSDQGSAARMYTGANTRNRTKKLAVEQVPSTSEHEQTRHRKNGVKWNKVSEPVEPILSNQGNKGLKLLSHRVKEIVAQRRKTTYKEVAEILIHESKYISYMNSEEDSGHPQRTHERNTLSSREEQNIKRRVYDALNVLIAAEVLLKEGKSVYYKLYCTNSLVTPSSQRVNSLTRANGMGAPNTSNTLGASHCSPGQVAQGFGGLYQCKTAVELLQKRDKLSRYYQQRLAELNTKRAELADKSGKLCVLLDILERNKESPMKPQQNTMLVQFPFVMVKVDSQQTDPSDPNSFITICQNNQQRNKLGFRCNTKLILIEDMNIIFPLSAYFNSREEIVDRLRRYVAKDEAMLLQHVLLRDT